MVDEEDEKIIEEKKEFDRIVSNEHSLFQSVARPLSKLQVHVLSSWCPSDIVVY